MSYQVLVFSDFDGTITGRAGKRLVFSSFYQSLLIGYKEGEINWNYKDSPILPESQLLTQFTKKFGPYDTNFDYSKEDSDILISKSAVKFFHQVLKNSRVKITVITKNRIEYTNTLFKYQGFNEEEIQNLHIVDKYMYSKGFEVGMQLADLPEKASWVYVLDDDEDDFTSMCEGVGNSGYIEKQIRKYNLNPGTFDWGTYLVDIEYLTSLQERSDDLQIESSVSSPSSVSGEKERVVRSISSYDSGSSSEIENDSSSNGSFSDLQVEHNLPSETGYKNNRIIQFVSIFAAVAFGFGFALGIASVASGVFAPFGLTLLGALGLGLATGSGLALISAIIGYDIAKSSEPDIDDMQLLKHSTVNGSHAIALVKFSPSNDNKKEPTDPGHYSSVLATLGDDQSKKKLQNNTPQLQDDSQVVSKLASPSY
jgi:hypothetical protein